MVAHILGSDYRIHDIAIDVNLWKTIKQLFMPYKEHVVERVYWPIGDVARELGIATSAVRFYEGEFMWIKPQRNFKNNRKYTKDVFEEVRKVHYLTVKGMTINGIREAHEKGYLDKLVAFFKEQDDETHNNDSSSSELV